MLRLVTALARTAAGYGADVLTHARARVAPRRTDGFKTVTLTLNDRTLEVSAAGLVNATGVWAGDIESDVAVTPSPGTHIVVDAEKVGNPTGALTVAVPGSINRFCFILPNQLGRCYIGLTDEKAQLADVPEAPESDVQWILDVVNQGLETTLTTDDVLGAFAGLRPLTQLRSASDVGSTADLSREHLILNNDGVVTVTGGKLTEYRLMAEQTIDELLDDDSVRTHLSCNPAPCSTKSIALVGASLERSPRISGNIATASAVATMPPRSLVERYGAEAYNVLAACALDNATERIAGLDITRAELSYAVTHEGAISVDDILDRRTRIGLVATDRAAAEPAAREALAAAGVQA